MRQVGALFGSTLPFPARKVKALLGALLLFPLGNFAEAQEPKFGGTLIVATTNDTPDLDIQKYTSSSQHNALLPIFDGLVEKDWTADADFPPIVPGLATSWSASADGKTYTFKLREGVKFHDGTPFNAEAANFNFQRMTNKEHPYYDQQAGSAALGVLKGLKGSMVVDEYTFQIELSEPNAGLIEALASLPNYYIMSPAAFEKYGKDAIGQNAVGTGPFKLVEWVRGQRTVMARNDDYWGKKPYVDQMVYRPIIEPAARAAALKAGEVQIAWDLPVDQVESFKSDTKYNVYLRGIPATKVIECWQASGPFSDKRVRKAVNMAIDRDTLANVILKGTAVPATQIYGIGSASYDPSLPVFEKYDPEAATALLAETSFPDGFNFFIITSPENEPVAGALQAYEFVQANLAEIGVNMEIRVRDNAVFGEVYMKAKADDECVTFDRGYDTDFILDMGYTGSGCVPNGMNDQCYKNDEVDALLQKAYTAANIEEWRKLHQQAQKLIIDDSGTIPLVHGLRPMAALTSVKNWLPAKAWLQYPGNAWLEN
ncbi:ABC transporter substrate-binding protein [Mesorhizobium escarrei]|uniref:Glutathione ABC transporter substrate-binding protein n=1 Tax=Mesorhizobium escarrei TaxID=666018 RepID=A0ABN8K7A8_9HYPH|nr:ABC transporter substrate-binding protein [Mesorhizobium escarrei]CAH2406137.1 putative Glutathione ABC transporter substrate-binding protein [Mesorhizobium escarrei]